MPPQYFEDVVVGDVRSFGEYELSEAEIVAFAERYDPQPIHVDPAAAADSTYGGLVASGWQIAAVTMRLLVEHVIDHETGMGSPGLEEIRWPAPVRPGDVLSVRHEVLETRPLESRPDRGLVRYEATTRKQDGTTVQSLIGAGLVARRPGRD